MLALKVKEVKIINAFQLQHTYKKDGVTFVFYLIYRMDHKHTRFNTSSSMIHFLDVTTHTHTENKEKKKKELAHWLEQEEPPLPV